jgi:hypothetical protein
MLKWYFVCVYQWCQLNCFTQKPLTFGWSKMNRRLHDKTPNRMLLDVMTPNRMLLDAMTPNRMLLDVHNI